MSKYDIFISYCRIDSTLAKQITHKLKELGLNCFLDVETLQLGSSFADTLQSVILESKYIIYIYGENSEDSIWQRRELDLALESGKKVISLVVNHSKEGIIHSILKKKTICHTSIEGVCNNIRKENSYLKKKTICHTSIERVCNNIRKENSYFTETDDVPIHNIEDKIWIRQYRKVKKIGYILLAVIALFVICLLVPFYYNTVPQDICSTPPCLSENNIDSICVYETLERDTVYISSKGNEERRTKTKITTLPQYQDWGATISLNRLLFTLVGLLLGVTSMLIVKLYRKKKNIKLSSDVNVSISIDGNPIAKISAGSVFSTHLDKGEYLIDFQSENDAHNRIIQKIVDKNTHVVFSEFLNKEEIKFKCFIAGSLALSTERNALIATVSKMYNRWESERFRITSYTFEDFNRDVVPGGQQKLYDKFIENEADWCVFIISNGIGEKTLNEYKVAMNSLKKYGHPKILFLASKEPAKDETLSVIKKEIMDANQYWNTCNNLEHMQSIFRDCLEWDVTLLSKSKNRRN